MALVTAIANNCACTYGVMGARTETCPPHKMLTDDQRALDGLLFMRRAVVKLTEQEFMCSPST